MDEEGTPSAHFRGLLGLKIKGARTLGGLMHDVDAVAQLVGGGREGTYIDHALFGRVVQAVS